MDKLLAEGFYVTGWRPALSWIYAFICLFDFIIAPVLVMIFDLYTHNTLVHWVPLTLSGGGLIHFSLGAYVTATSFGRTKEKMSMIDRMWGKSPLPPTTEPKK